MASIAVRPRKFHVGNSPFAHNYLVHYDDDGNFVAEMDGWAADARSGEETEDPVGRSRHNLRGYEYPYKQRYRDGDFEQTLWQGAHGDVTARWQAARAVLDQINRRNLTYNLWGSDLNGPRNWDDPPPPVIAGNSNSAYRSYLDAMGIRAPSLPDMAPGTETPLLSQSEVEQIRTKYGLPLPKGALL